jgi:chromosome segregation ATPase
MQPVAVNVEANIQAEVEELRGKFPQTQELYREVCILLFFRCGITPTANKLYQYVRKGSMSAPAEALNRFWADLRERSRARIEHPDLPEAIKVAAGELAAALWTQAQQLSQESLATLRAEAQNEVAEAKAARDVAMGSLDVASIELSSARQTLLAANQRVSQIEQELAAETATRVAIGQQLTVARDAIAAAQLATEDARREFSSELEKLRSAAQLSEDRYRAAEQRALLEIDRERSAGVRLQKELDAVRDASTAAVSRHRLEIEPLQAQIGDLRQRNGVLEGNLQAMRSAQDKLSSDLSAAQNGLSLVSSQVAALAVDRDAWQRAAAEAEQSVRNLQRQLGARSKAKAAPSGSRAKPTADMSPEVRASGRKHNNKK